MASRDEHDSDASTTTPVARAPAASAAGDVAPAVAPAVAAESESLAEREALDAAEMLDESLPRLMHGGLGSGLLAQQPTPSADETVAVAKVCPQCGGEYETGDRFCPKDGSPLRPKSGGDPLVGRVIADRYLVLALLGEGGMGRVYLAEHVKMNRQCAIKVMNPALVNDAESSQRFAREASSAARILHPNVAAVFDYGESDKIVYLVMEYVDGESLSAILANEGALDPRRAVDLARQIAEGLAAAHELSIVHRDLKPDNVIVARNRAGREIPKIVDFGIAKAVSEAPQDSLTRSGLVIGTPEYMSPEQLLGDPLDARSDVYSLGCILYQMLTGKPAFAADTREQMIRRRLHEPPPHVRDVLPDLPRRLDTLIVHMLARSPGDRLATAAQARDALDPALALAGWDPKMITVQRPTPRMSYVSQRATPVPSDPSLRPTMPMRRQGSSVSRLVTRTLLGAGLIAGGIVFWTLRQAPPPRAPAVSPVDSSGAALGPTPAGTAETTAAQVIAPPVVKSPHTPVVTHPKPRPDSVALAARRDSARKDSSAGKDTAAPRNPLDTAAWMAPIHDLLNTLELGDSAKSTPEFKMLPAGDQQLFSDLYARIEKNSLRITASNITRSISVNSSEVAFRMQVKYYGQNREPGSLNALSEVATLEKRGDKWVLKALRAGRR